MRVEQKISDLGITLPAAATPAAVYVPFVQSGNLLFVSGHIAKRGAEVWSGQLGRDLQTADGKAAARLVAIDLMGTLKAALGDLDRVERIVKVMGLVNSTPDFTEQHLVINGASDLMKAVFGDIGQHARAAVGVASLPLGAPVEVEAVFALK